jgi:hypothetical protein
MMMGRRGRIDHHAANGVFHHSRAVDASMIVAVIHDISLPATRSVTRMDLDIMSGSSAIVASALGMIPPPDGFRSNSLSSAQREWRLRARWWKACIKGQARIRR